MSRARKWPSMASTWGGQEPLRLEKTASAGDLCLCLSGKVLFKCVMPHKKSKVLTVLFSRGRITVFFSFAYLKFLPSTWTFFME